MVTAELALAIPALVLVVALLITVVGVASDIARASDAARSAARAASIGTDVESVVTAAQSLAPPNADIRVEFDDGWARVSVRPEPRSWGPLTIPTPAVTGSAPIETGVLP